MSADVLIASSKGLECPGGRFVIDPQKPVDTALITHAHADHARPGSRRYYATAASVPILRQRLGGDTDIRPVDYGQTCRFGRTEVSFHSAGHVLGSAQIRVAQDGEVWVASGDFKRLADPTCEPFEPVQCDTFICEATFALPIYRWPPTEGVVDEIFDWWQANRAAGHNSVLFCYAFGKAQRVLAELNGRSERPILLHGAVATLVERYREAGVEMAATARVDLRRKQRYRGELIIAPPGASGSPWVRRFAPSRTGFCSGWMRVRGNRRRQGYDRGFVLSDHADWPGLLRTIRETGARRVLLNHGFADTLVRYLREQGLDAGEL